MRRWFASAASLVALSLGQGGLPAAHAADAPTQGRPKPKPRTRPRPPTATPTPTPTATPTPPATPTLSPQPRDAVAAPVPSTRDRGHELLFLQVGPEVGARHLQYTDALSTNLRRYDLGAAPLAAATAGIYPFAMLSSPVDVGLVGGYAQAFALSSAPLGGDAVHTNWWRFHAGLRGRARIGSSVVLGVGAAYGGETFGFASSSLDPQSPAVAYRFVRPSVDVRVAFGRFAVAGSVGYDVVLSAGGVADRFPHAKVGGVEAQIGPAFALSRAWEVGATASYRRFFYAMHPVPGEPSVAGGALDEMLGLQGSVSYVF